MKPWKRLTATLLAAALLLQLAACSATEGNDNVSSTQTVSRSENCLDVITDMVHNNPGKVAYDSAYNDPAFLTQRGLTGKVFFLYDAAQFGLDWKDYDPDILPDGSTELQWVQEKKAQLTEKYDAAKAAGQKVYFMMDMIVFPERVKTLYGDEILTNGKIDIQKEKTQEMLRYMFEAMFTQFPQIDGIYVRTGETYVGGFYGSEPGNSAPYYFGNNPAGVSGDRTKDHLTLINLLREELCVKRDKELIYRTWGFDDFQKTEEGYLKISDQVEPHDKLYFAIKYTSGDFWRNYEFNQSLNSGKHKQIVEIQCAREYEGKGAFPNYIGDGVINGFEEYEWQMEEGEKKSLRDVINVEGSKVVGVWTWSRGGGWGGPYINGSEVPDGSELWCDVNAYVLQKWAQDPTRTDKELVLEYAREALGMNDTDAENFYNLCILSARAVLLGRGTNQAPTIDMLWTRDDNVDANRFKNVVNVMYSGKDGDSYPKLEERRKSVKLWEDILAIVEGFDDGVEMKNYMHVTTQYGYYLFSIFERMFTIGVLYRESLAGQDTGDAMREAIADYDRLWAEWEQLKQDNSCCPTLYQKSSFDDAIQQYRDAAEQA